MFIIYVTDLSSKNKIMTGAHVFKKIFNVSPEHYLNLIFVLQSKITSD